MNRETREDQVPVAVDYHSQLLHVGFMTFAFVTQNGGAAGQRLARPLFAPYRLQLKAKQIQCQSLVSYALFVSSESVASLSTV